MDLVPLSDLDSFTVADAVVGGRAVAEQPAPTQAFTDYLRLDPAVARDLVWRADLPDGEHPFHAIRVNPVDTSTAATSGRPRVIEFGGGIVVRTDAGSAELALPVGGVMTDAPLAEVSRADLGLVDVLPRRLVPATLD